MIEIRVIQPKDIPLVRQLLLNTYETSFQADWIDKLRKAGFYDKELALVALMEGNVIGHILFTRVVVKQGKQNYPGLALALCSVHPDFQKQKVGTQLMEQGLKKCKYLGYKFVFVSGLSDYFKRFDFKPLDSEAFSLGLHYALETPYIHYLTDDALEMTGTIIYPKEFITE